MPGIIPHVIVATCCLLIVHFIHFKWEYGFAIFVGNFIPDVITFGFSALKQGTLAVFSVAHDTFFETLVMHSYNYKNWLSLGFFVFGTTAMLYHFHIIKKKKMEEYDELYVFFLMGIILHIIMDVLMIEQSIWF